MEAQTSTTDPSKVIRTLSSPETPNPSLALPPPDFTQYTEHRYTESMGPTEPPLGPSVITAFVLPIGLGILALILLAIWRCGRFKMFQTQREAQRGNQVNPGGTVKRGHRSTRSWGRDTIILDVEGDAAGTGLPLSQLPGTTPKSPTPPRVHFPNSDRVTMEPPKVHDTQSETISINGTNRNSTATTASSISPLASAVEPRINPAFLEKGKYGKGLRRDMNRNFSSLDAVVDFASFAPSHAIEKIAVQTLSGAVTKNRPRTGSPICDHCHAMQGVQASAK